MSGERLEDEQEQEPPSEGARSAQEERPGVGEQVERDERRASEEPRTEAEEELATNVRADLAELDIDAPRVGIVVGDHDDLLVLAGAERELEERAISYEVRVMSAQLEPEVVNDYARNAHMRGLQVIIAGAGLGAALPGIVAAHTDLPVIGVPLGGPASVAGGLDALLAIAQMPAGVPVACVGVNAARNSAILAARILGLGGAAPPGPS